MGYFTKHETISERKRSPEVSLRNFHSSVKAGLLRAASSPRYGSFPCLLDLGAGRGSDCSRYAFFGHTLALDRDIEALRELNRRAMGRVDTICADMTKPLGLRQQVTAVSAMFSCHYGCGSPESLRTLAGNVADALLPGGCFVGLDMDGETVLEAFGGRTEIQFFGWAFLKLVAGPSLEVTIRSISDQPKQESLLMWPFFLTAMQDANLQLERTGMVDPACAVPEQQLQAFSRLHRWWIFRKPAVPVPPHDPSAV